MNRHQKFAYSFAVAFGTAVGIGIGIAVTSATNLLMGLPTAAVAGGVTAYASYLLQTKVFSRQNKSADTSVES